MLQSGVLFEDTGILSLGPKGEKLYGAKNYMALMSVFDTPSLFHVFCGLEDLGSVHPLSFAGFGQRPVVISLGGRSWEVIQLDDARAVAHVRLAEVPGRSRWLGQSRALGFSLCQKVRALLAEESVDAEWSKRAVTEIAAARQETDIARRNQTVLEFDMRLDRTRWWTFAGLRANAWLASTLGSYQSAPPRFDNYWLDLQGSIDVDKFEQDFNYSALGCRLREPPAKIKFWECLPEPLRDEYCEERFADPESASTVLNTPRVNLRTHHSG